MMKWLEICKIPSASQELYYKKAIEISGQSIELQSMIWPDDKPMTLPMIKEVAAGYDLVFFTSEIRVSPRELFEKMHSDIYQADEFDAIKISGDQAWPIHFYAKSFRHFIANEIEILDRNASALIAGTDIFPGAVAVVLAQLGFKQIKLVSLDENEVSPLLKHWSRSFFSIDWSFESTDSLTEDSGRFSIAVSCVAEENEILNTLYYFNFLQNNGVVLDLRLGSDSRMLIKEANEIAARSYSGFHMFGNRMNVIFEEFNIDPIPIDVLCAEFAKIDSSI